MSTTLIIIFSVLGFLLLMCIIGIFYGLPGLFEEYPKELEKGDKKEIKRKFNEHNKNRDN